MRIIKSTTFLIAALLAGPAGATFGFTDIGFDTQGASVPASNYCYLNAGACPSGVWTSSSGGFINGHSDAWGNPPAPSQPVVAFVQGLGALSQTFTASASARVRLAWFDADRPTLGHQTYTVSINGNVVATVSPTNSSSFGRRYSAPFSIVSGTSYTVTFQGTINEDRSFFIDTVDVLPASETITYSYDSLGRLTSTFHAGAINAGLTSNYQYDPANNRSQVTVAGAPQ
jgi:hypothetical protein